MIQLQAINYILNNNDASIITLNNFDENYFSDYKDEYNYIIQHYNEYGNVPDKETFIDKFRDFDFIDVNESSKFIIDGLVDDYNKRCLANTFNKVRSFLNAGDTQSALNEFKNSVDKLSNKAISLESFDLFKDSSRYDAYVERCNDFNKFYVKTGFEELDDIFGGWDRQEELATIIARTNQGKSWLLLKTAIAAAKQGLKVGLYSGEMSERKVGYRVDTLISNISNYSIIHGNANIQNEYKKYIDELNNGMIKGSIKVITPSSINGPAGVGALKAFIEAEKLDMLCVDQHSLLEDDRHAKNPVEKAANISRDLKNLQVLKRIPIISVCQQNRSSTENGVDTTHIAQSDRIGQDSTIVLAFEQKDGVLTMTIVKSRDSAVGKKLQYAIDFDKGTFVYIPSSDDANSGKGSEKLKDEYDYGEQVF